MEIRVLRYFLEVAREGSVTAAAKKLYVSQPSLSQMLKQVERELGVTLFDRSVSPFQLTYAGEKYLQAANTILSANERLENQLQEIREENSGRLRLGISVQRAMQVLPLALPWFMAQFPHVLLEITERGSAHLEELVLQGQVDQKFPLPVGEGHSDQRVGPVAHEDVAAVHIIAQAGNIVAQRINPHIDDMLIIEIHRNSPLE